MSISRWETLYRDAHARGMERLQSIPGVACAFHSVLDGWIRITPSLLHSILDSNAELHKAAMAGCKGEYPCEINTPADFVSGLFHSLYKGAALQLMIRSEETYRWALATFGAGELRLGGTSGNMARSLAPLGIPVTVYANPLTVELAERFGDYDNLRVISQSKDGYRLQKPIDAAFEQGVFAIHWILEYGSDFSMNFGELNVSPNRANRYIPSWNPRNNQFKMEETFANGFVSLIDSYSHLFFSGFHILSDRYPDGSTCDDVIEPLERFLKRIRLVAPSLKIHLEMASIASSKVRESVLNHIAPNVHSIGLNEIELPLLLASLGDKREREILRDVPTALNFCRGMAALKHATGLQRVHFHNFGYYLCLEQPSWSSPESSRDALLFAAIMASARARNGLFTSRDDIAAGLNTPISESGFNQLKILGEALKQPSLSEKGTGTFEQLSLTAIPAKIVENPLFTVGLGDTISSGAFMTE
ncbi:MAG: hypothetical protein C4527_17100 [Candidatus Omnitrophota bacterium]|jgi:ADP-dependent phosphofructokinase/glucokinase|nr:MAG: hypothetical protein C4527_17100 [Candidatus Omnitrophota bacterium]